MARLAQRGSYRAVISTALLLASVCTEVAGQGILGEPPRRPAARERGERPPVERTQPRLQSRAGVDTSSRAAVATFFDTVYTSAFSVPSNWTGSVAGCIAGTTSQAYIDATFDVINYFRAMVGLADVSNDASLNPASQEAALMMRAEGSLSHNPGPSWACYTAAGATAAGSSNLALGAAGPGAIRLYALDSGSFNAPVGHRRWLLHPPRLTMGTGSTTSSNALWVFGATGPRPSTPSAITWPPAGFVPYQVTFARWSFSLNSAPSANYGSAAVTMTGPGGSIPLTVISRTDNGFGDNTIVWEPSGLSVGPGMTDTTYSVTVSNIGGASPSSVNYEVTVIDPAIPGTEIFTDGFESGDLSRWSAVVP